MAVVDPIDIAIANKIKKKLGHAWGYGKKIYGQNRYGAKAIISGQGQYGIKNYGITKYGDAIEKHGIYYIRIKNNKQVIVKRNFYWPSNPQTEAQQANRQKYANAIVAWQNLTDEQKEIYNETARYKPYSGFNLYTKEYMLSN